MLSRKVVDERSTKEEEEEAESLKLMILAGFFLSVRASYAVIAMTAKRLVRRRKEKRGEEIVFILFSYYIYIYISP